MSYVTRRRPSLTILLSVSLALAACQMTGGDYPSAEIEIMAPADPGGGWDSTARAMQRALDSGVVDVNVSVYNVPGAAGTIGLAQFVDQNQGDPHQLMVMGLVMVGGILTNQSAVTLDQITPIASLTTEWEAIAVASDSPYQSLADLIDDFKADPISVAWGGGSAGGTDHMVVALIAKAAGVDPGQINYVANAGGGELVPAVLAGDVAAGVSGISEFADQVDAGEMRLLAVTSDERVEGVDAPTVSEAAGLDVVISNWRGVVAPPGISDAQRDAVIGVITDMHGSGAWQQELEEAKWTDLFKTGDEFASFLEDEQVRVEAVLRDIGLIT
jgi:putative tricarboxylic transport membrane protein